MDSRSIHWDCIAGKSDAAFGIIVSASFKQIRQITITMILSCWVAYKISFHRWKMFLLWRHFNQLNYDRYSSACPSAAADFLESSIFCETYQINPCF